MREETPLSLINVETGDVTPVVQRKPGIGTHDAAWSYDGKQIFYLRVRTGRTAYTRGIVVRNLETGEEKELRRDAIAFAQPGARRRKEIWAMENFLPELKAAK